MVDMAALMECIGALSSTPVIRRRNEGAHALSHMGEGLFMVTLAPTPSAYATSSPTARTYQVVKVRPVGQRPAGHLVLGLSNQVQLQNALEPAVESTEPCGFDTWVLNVFDEIFFWEEATRHAADELNNGKPCKRPCLSEGPSGTTETP